MVQSFRAATSAAILVHSDLLAKWLPHIDLSQAEREFCEHVAILAPPKTQIDDETGRHILLDLNALMQQARKLDTQRAEIERLSSAESIAELESERDRIARRLESTRDPQARADLEESLSLCSSRLDNARHMT